MKVWLQIYRQKDRTSEGHFQEYELEAEEGMTVAQALNELNRRHPEDAIAWEHSCLQKKCGACAMVINGRPGLACDCVVADAAKKGRIRIEPLRKFPVVADLIVDRSILFENLKTMHIWAGETLSVREEDTGFAYEASRCLQCGCCLEVCPNFYEGGAFFGMASMTPAARLLAEMPEAEQEKLRREYRAHVYNGCGKSLACQNVCPAGIDVEHLMSRSNAVSVWKNWFRRGRRKRKQKD